MAPARGPAPANAAAAGALLVVAVVLLASPGAHAWGWGERCMDLCFKECLKQSAEVEESKRLNATQCQYACNVACPIGYLIGHQGKPEDVKPPPDVATPATPPPAAKYAAGAAGRNGRDVPAHYVCFLIQVAFATLWY